jgi:hypothetical protein
LSLREVEEKKMELIGIMSQFIEEYGKARSALETLEPKHTDESEPNFGEEVVNVYELNIH